MVNRTEKREGHVLEAGEVTAEEVDDTNTEHKAWEDSE